MEIDRKEKRNGGFGTALCRVGYCLDRFEESNVSLSGEIVKNLLVEEMVGALVSAEQVLLEIKEDWRKE